MTYKRAARIALYAVQLSLLHITYWLLAPWSRHVQPVGAVVGPEEIASCMRHFSDALTPSVTVSLFPHPFYNHSYNFDLTRWRHLKWLVAPCLLAYLVRRHRTFVYIGGHGYLVSQVDGRAREFRFLRRRGKVIVCYFTGTDIRSHLLLDDFGKQRSIDVITTYQKISSPDSASASAEDGRRALARAADAYAEVVFNAPVDQMGYLKRRTEPVLYFYPDELIRRIPEKWQSAERIVVVHAPSSPLIKGTPLVRAAVKKLRMEAYDFEYVELLSRPHSEVLAVLERAHVVLNEFYSFVPGVFGVEAMASNAVLLTSADADIEPSLFEGANDAWVVTPYWMIYDNLRKALDSRRTLQLQADRGTDWVSRHCSRESSRRYLKARIDV